MLKLKGLISKTILFVGLFYIFGMFAGCESPTNIEGSFNNENLLFAQGDGLFITEGNFDESVLFIEYGVYTKGEYDGDFYGGCCYYFDNGCIRFNNPDRMQINNSDKFLFGKHQNSVTESVTAQESFYKTDTLISSFSGRCYEIKMIGCNSRGEVTISLNDKKINLNPNQKCYGTFTYPDGTNGGRGCCVNYLQEVVVINNVGFIKKTDISYQDYSLTYQATL